MTIRRVDGLFLRMRRPPKLRNRLSALTQFKFTNGKVFTTAILAAVLWAIGPALVADDSLLITEILAANVHTIRDDVGEFSDAIEIFNNGTNSIDLAGYFLSDEQANLTKWRFPSTNLPPNHYLVVYASGLDHRTPGRPFHTNFKLNADGEYLGLIKPDGLTILSEFAPTFPPQQEGISFGLAAEDILNISLVATGAEARVFIPTNNVGTAWTELGFDDSAWLKAKTAIKFDLNSLTPASQRYENVPGTDISAQMLGRNASAYLRIPFNCPDPSKINDLQLWMKYDDGFVAYLNGRETARRLAPVSTVWNSAAVNQHSNVLALVSEMINLSDNLDLLKSGENILAIQGLNRGENDTDFLMLPELVARQVRVLTNVSRYFGTPSIGSANISGLPGTAGEVHFSKKTTTFFDPFLLELAAAESNPGAVIRYTLDRSLPGATSPIYSSPLNIRTNVMVRAQVYTPGLIAGLVKTESFIALSANVVNFTSDLPILVLHSFGGGRLNGVNYTPAIMTIHEPVRGRSSLTNAPQAFTRAAFKDRGSSTGGQVKANYAVQIWDEQNLQTDFSILGMPADSDWVFHAPFNWDPSLFRNPLTYELGRRTGRYASRYRFVEVYISSATTNGPISSASYVGVYNILEKVKRGKDRVDIDELRPGDVQLPEVSGGYLMKIDRLDPGDSGINAGGRSVAMVEPKEAELKTPDRAGQRLYLIDFLNKFNTALNGPNFTHPTLGYAPYVDSAAWIDFHIVDTLTENVDALVLSSYFHKPRSGPMAWGPLWDYDRAWGSTDGRDSSPRVWGNNFFTTPWWSRMFRDPNFWQMWIDRWQELRGGELGTKNVLAVIDSLASQVQEAAPRDFVKWRQPKRGNTEASEVNFLKNWVTNRLDFMDTNLLRRPILSRVSGPLFPGFILSITGPDSAAIYYTLDGSDPRSPGGQISPTARVYTGSIALPSTTTVKARAYDVTHKNLTGGNNPPITSPWSGPAQARYSSNPPAAADQLIVTEIQYNPSNPSANELALNKSFQSDDFEFVELKNVSGGTLDLFGVTLAKAVEFSFSGSNVETLEAGQYVLVVKNRAAFEARYGKRPNIAGEFKGSLDNNGERIEVLDMDRNPILAFDYRDDLFPITNGHGFSLVLNDEARTPGQWTQKGTWRPSAQAGGSPGQSDPAPKALPAVVINEVLSYTDKKDAIELQNPTGLPADIGGWFLTDDLGTPRKFRIPNGTIIPAGGYKVFDEDNFNPKGDAGNSFSFSRFGEQVYLFSADSLGNLQWYLHGFSFGASDKEVTFGRYITSTGDEEFFPQASATLKSLNTGPKIGPLVISEIMYHPKNIFLNDRYWDDDEGEFIEIQNITSLSVPLYDLEHPTNTWSLRGGVDFDFPTNVFVPPQSVLLLVNFNGASNPAQLTAFRAKYNVATNVAIFGPYQGKLDNGAGRLKLFKPGEPGQNVSTNGIKVPEILAEEINYSDNSPWPVAADGLGYSLQRIESAQFGNDPMNWTASPPTPGAINRRATLPPAFTTHPQSQTIVAGRGVAFVAAATAKGSISYQWQFQGQTLIGETNATLTISKVGRENAGEYRALALSADNSASSQIAKLTVLEPVSIAIQPTGVNVNPGGQANLGVSVKASGPVTYQWQFNGADIFGANGPTLAVTNVQITNSGVYSVLVSDRVGSVTSEPALVAALIRPEIISQTLGQSVFVGDPVVMNVLATGLNPLSFKWRKDSINIPNATNSVFALKSAQLEDTGIYSVLITNLASGRVGTVSLDMPLFVFTDFDRDRMADIWEMENGLATNNAADALIDTDGDGFSNLQEYIAGTNPRDKSDYFKIDSLKFGSTAAEIQFLARSNKTYSVQFRDVFGSAGWSTLTNLNSQATSRVEAILDSSPKSRARFYRLVTPALP